MFPASFLATLEESTNEPIGNYFDLIVGTSTGGIIALGLGLGFSASDIATFYEELGANVFSGIPILKSLRQIFLSKYAHKSLHESLKLKFGAKRLGESTKRIVIPSLNIETGEVHIFKTAHHPKFQRDYKEYAVDVALATASAPTYFPSHILPSGTPLVDGGLFANNPIGLAVIEAITILKWPQEEIKVLSIGCTTNPMSIGLGRKRGLGYWYWGPRISEVFMSAQSSLSLGTAALLIGHTNITRISPTIEQGRFSLDSTRELRSLKGLGHTEARKAFPILETIFFQNPADPFRPYKTVDDHNDV